MFSMGRSKSPGPDGFTAEFFVAHWNRVGASVVSGIQQFFNSGFLLKEWNHSLLIMIPKVANPQTVNHMRPISLCNTIYKCASKCLVTRLKVVLPSLIEFQHAFIPGRYMSDNVILCQDLLEKINRRTAAGPNLAAIKIDMSKAYDRVHWGFLISTLHAFGFPARWLTMIL